MASEMNYHQSISYKSITQMVAYLLILLGLMVLLGWGFDIAALKSVFPGLALMKANTAIGFFLLGIALWSLSLDPLKSPRRWKFWVQQGCSLVVTLIGFFTLLEYVFGLDFGIDQLLFRGSVYAVGTSHLGRMSHQAALCFTLSGLAMLILDKTRQSKKYTILLAVFSLVIVLFGLGALLSYLVDLTIGHHVWNITGMALHTALAFILFGMVLFFITGQNRRVEWTLDKFTTILFASGIIILLLVGIMSFHNIKQLRDSMAWVAHTQEVLKELRGIVSEITEIQTDYRGYILMEDDSLLKSYKPGIKEVQIDLNDVRRLTADNIIQQKHLDILEPLITQWIGQSRELIALRKEKGLEPALQFIKTGKGLLLMEKIRKVLDDMDGEENRLLKQREEKLMESEKNIFFILPTGIFISFVLLCSVMFLLNRGITQRKQAEEALREKEHFLSESQRSAQLGSWSVDSNGQTTFSDETYRIFGISQDTYIPNSDSFTNLIHPDDRTAMQKWIASCQAGEKPGELEFRIIRPDGNIRYISGRGELQYDGVNKQSYMTGTAQDITDHKRVEEALRTSLQIIEGIINAIPTRVFWKDKNLVYLGCNLAFAHDAGFADPKDVIGKDDYQMGWREQADLYRTDDRHVIESGIPRLLIEEPQTNPDGNNITLLTSKLPLHNFKGEISGILGTYMDITERKRADDELLYRSRLGELGAEIGVALTQGESVQIVLQKCTEAMVRHLDAAFARIWTLNEKENMLELQASAGIYTHIDGAHRRVPVGKFKIGLIAEERKAHLTNTVIGDPRVGDQEWAKKEGMVAFAGYPLLIENRLVGVMAMFAKHTLSEFTLKGLATIADEVSLGIERKQADARLALANDNLKISIQELGQRNHERELLAELGDLLQSSKSVVEAYKVMPQYIQKIFPSSSGAIFELAASRNVLNEACKWGDTITCENFFQPDDCWALRRSRIHQVTDPTTGILCQHVKHFPSNGYLCVPMMSQGETFGVFYLEQGTFPTPSKGQLAVVVAERIALALANLKLRDTLKNLSIRDPLTGLFNRRYLAETLEREISRANRKKTPLAVMMMDIDHFKRYNDTYGHEMGDILLQQLGKFLRSHLRTEDIACRYGGEEFTIALLDCSLEDAFKRAEKMRQDVKTIDLQYGNKHIEPVTISIGISIYPENGNNTESLLRSADKALYEAKNSGRDRVIKYKGI